jgi:hypothetical protein
MKEKLLILKKKSLKKLIICLCILLFGNNFANSQNIDRINISAIPFNYEYAAEGIKADYVRAFPVYFLSVINKQYVEEIYNYFFNDSSFTKIIKKSPYDPDYGVRVVIDFIGHSKLKCWVIINLSDDLYINNFFYDDKKSKEFHLTKDDICSLKKYICFWDLLDGTKIQCH